MLIAKTTKGKGISFIENNNQWHHNILTKQKYEASSGRISIVYGRNFQIKRILRLGQ